MPAPVRCSYPQCFYIYKCDIASGTGYGLIYVHYGSCTLLSVDYLGDNCIQNVHLGRYIGRKLIFSFIFVVNILNFSQLVHVPDLGLKY